MHTEVRKLAGLLKVDVCRQWLPGTHSNRFLTSKLHTLPKRNLEEPYTLPKSKNSVTILKQFIKE